MWSAGTEKSDLALRFLSAPQRSFTLLFRFIWIGFTALISRWETCWWTQWCMWYWSNTELNAEWIPNYPGWRWRLNRSHCLVNKTELYVPVIVTDLRHDKWAPGQLVVSCPWTDHTMRAVLYWVSSGWSVRPNIASVSFTLEMVGTCHQHLVKCFHPHHFHKIWLVRSVQRLSSTLWKLMGEHLRMKNNL